MIGGTPWWGWLIGVTLISPFVAHAVWWLIRDRRSHRHQWRRQHPPLWGVDLPDRGYFDCSGCPERRVSEPDSYSYVGWPWIVDGTLPPATWMDASMRPTCQERKP